MSQSTAPVLIVAFKRAENVREILRICKLNGVHTVYVVVDGPRTIEDDYSINNVRSVVLEAAKDDFFTIRHYFRDSNVGCSASVVSACDWFFSQVDYGAILEDDCLPSDGFFTFVNLAKKELICNPKIALGCGTQLLIDQEKYSDSWILSRYAFHWGWCSTSDSWFKSMSYLMKHPPRFKDHFFSLRSPENIYWFAGARRAFQGYSDVWDALISNYLYKERLFVLLPTMNLVTNLGNDRFATHTAGNRVDTMREVHPFVTPNEEPKYLNSFDQIAKEAYFKIKFRHILTTTVTLLHDYITFSRKKVSSLTERRSKAKLLN
jgi:hypothetical protein